MRVDERGELVPFVVGGARPIDNTVFRAYETLPVVQVDDPPPPPCGTSSDRPTAARTEVLGSAPACSSTRRSS